jgi:hypothetical protein
MPRRNLLHSKVRLRCSREAYRPVENETEGRRCSFRLGSLGSTIGSGIRPAVTASSRRLIQLSMDRPRATSLSPLSFFSLQPSPPLPLGAPASRLQPWEGGGAVSYEAGEGGEGLPDGSGPEKLVPGEVLPGCGRARRTP